MGPADAPGGTNPSTVSTGEAAPAATISTWGLPGSIVAAAWLGGGALPMAWGWLPALGIVVAAAIVARRRIDATPLGGWALAVRARGPTLRGAVVLAAGFPAVVLAAVLAGAVAQVLFAFPGATLAVGFVLVAGAMLDRLGRAGAWLLPPCVIVLAILGARCEADGVDARGGAWSGPVLGIHPFQTTAVVIDGFGPFDLPINDFVEPLGGRGYDPPAYAEAMELALHRIAEVHFADGPARARAAFAGADVGFIRTPAVLERLDSVVTETHHPRIVVRSGTTGQRSRVEFVCPGRRDDPRPPRPETVMSRACPTKYASEASAGLGLTGRWPGYAEFRGNERYSLARLLGETRVDGTAGADWRVRERWLYAVLVLVGVLVISLVRRGAAAEATVAAAGPIALPLVLLLAALAFARSDLSHLAAWTTAPPWMSASSPATWLGALVWPAAAALLALGEPRRSWQTHAVRGRALWLFAMLAWLASTDLDASQWVAPSWWVVDGALEPAVLSLADGIATLGAPGLSALPIEELETLAAAVLAAPMVVAMVVAIRAVGAAAAAAVDPDRAASRQRWFVVAAVVLAVALGVSRKTAGGVALLPAALGVALVLGSTLRRISAQGPWTRPHVPLVAIVIHLAWVAIGLVLVVGAWPSEGGDPVRWAYFGLAFVAAALPLAACLPDRAPRAARSDGAGPAGDDRSRPA